MFERAKGLVDAPLVADLEQVAFALRLMAERNRIIAEGAGACPVACAIAGQAGRGKVVCIVSGGNIDFDTLCGILTGTDPAIKTLIADTVIFFKSHFHFHWSNSCQKKYLTLTDSIYGYLQGRFSQRTRCFKALARRNGINAKLHNANLSGPGPVHGASRPIDKCIQKLSR